MNNQQFTQPIQRKINHTRTLEVTSTIFRKKLRTKTHCKPIRPHKKSRSIPHNFHYPKLRENLFNFDDKLSEASCKCQTCGGRISKQKLIYTIPKQKMHVIKKLPEPPKRLCKTVVPPQLALPQDRRSYNLLDVSPNMKSSIKSSLNDHKYRPRSTFKSIVQDLQFTSMLMKMVHSKQDILPTVSQQVISPPATEMSRATSIQQLILPTPLSPKNDLDNQGKTQGLRIKTENIAVPPLESVKQQYFFAKLKTTRNTAQRYFHQQSNLTNSNLTTMRKFNQSPIQQIKTDRLMDRKNQSVNRIKSIYMTPQKKKKQK